MKTSLKHRLFLVFAKWIPVATAIGILFNNTLAYLNIENIITDIIDFSFGVSIAYVILMYTCSYAFYFCIWHKLVVTYNASVIFLVFLIKYILIDCSDLFLLSLYYILAGIIILFILYFHNKKKH